MKNKQKVSNSTILYRSETNRVLGGVCGGLGEVFNVDPTLLRVLFILAFVFGGAGLLLYIILWVVVPSKSKVSNASDVNIRENIEEMKERAQSFTKDFHHESDRNKLFFGIFILLIGVMFLLGNFGFGYLFNLKKLWPIFLIGFGAFIVLKRGKLH